MTIGIPIIIKHKGIAKTIYSSIDSWKLRDAFPFIFTQADSSLLVSQQIRGPIIPPKGKRNRQKLTDDKASPNFFLFLIKLCSRP